MRHLLCSAALASFLCPSVFAQRPTPAQQQQTLNAARDLALHYSSQLPDFICNEDVTRTSRTSPTNIHTDRLTIQLSFNGQKENYQLVAINGAKTQQTFLSLDGLVSGGEFGSLLKGVFDPSSSAQFEWKQSTTIKKRAATVYTYKIARANSHYEVGVRTKSGGVNAVAAGYHGEVSLDAQSSRVLRLTAVADDMPKNSGVLQSSFEVDYGSVDIAGKSYLLPSRSEAHMERGYTQIDNAITYTGYRKFEADAAISFK